VRRFIQEWQGYVSVYGNALLGGMPTALLFYASMAIMSNPEIFEEPIIEKESALIRYSKYITRYIVH
jgi:hypothetical protein